EALRTWADRRERITYHAAATLIEFASSADLERGLRLWPPTSAPPVRVSDRLLLVADEESVPYRYFRKAGARDYSHEPEACLEVGPDGVSLTLDLARSDLLIDAELARLADEQPIAAGSPRRRFVVTARSLARAAEQGLSATALGSWYQRRTGAEMP